MNTMTFNREASTYWEQVKNASQQVKLEPRITREDLEITPFVSTLGQGIKPLPEDFDYDKAKQEYLMQKYG